MIKAINLVKLSKEKILSMEKGKVLKDIIQSFTDIGYYINYKILNSADYGIPQIRERVIFIGTRLNKNIIFPKASHSPFVDTKEINFLDENDYQVYITLEEAIAEAIIEMLG